VRGVVQIRAAMKRANGERLDCSAASSAQMNHPGVRPETNAPSSVTQATAEVRIFPIEEVTLVKPADLVEGLRSHQNARAADPVNRRGRPAFRQQNVAARQAR
jgi:hypothetical protein